MERPIKKKAVAGKAKSKTAPRRKKRRVSGAGDLMGMVMKAGGLILGAVGARQLNAIAVKFFPSLDAKLSGAIQILAGYMLPKYVKGPFFANFGDGMIANGGMVLIVNVIPALAGVMNGTLGAVGGDTMTYRIGGTSYMKSVGGTDRLRVVAGTNRIGNPRPGVKVTRNWSNTTSH